MKTTYLPSFIKDLKRLKSSSVYQSIKILTFETIPNLSNLQEINHLKKLKADDNAYRIRLGDYRIGILIEEDCLIFTRVLHRREFYRYFP
jgi:mRNA-degrading endonuclease RelE of RelBE toxin-antitoxin system